MGLALGSPEVEAYVADLREVEQRLAEAPPEATQDRIDRFERELAALRRRFVDGAATSRMDQRGTFVVYEGLNWSSVSVSRVLIR